MSIVGAYIVPHPPLILPEVGRGDEQEIKDTVESYHEIAKEIGELNPDTIIIGTPHSIMYSNYIHISPGESAKGDFGRFGAPQVAYEAKYDEELVEELENEALRRNLNAGQMGEKDSTLDHGTMIPLHFIDQYLQDYNIVRIGISGLSNMDHYEMGKIIKDVSEKLNRKTVFVASGDLSHKLKEDGPYGFDQAGVEFDRDIIKFVDKGDFKSFLEFSEEDLEAAAECGLRTFIMMAGALDKTDVDSGLLSYEGNFGVGYAVARYKILGEDESRNIGEIYLEDERKKVRALRESESPYVKLARKTIENHVRDEIEGEIPDDLLSEMTDHQAGVFVTLKKHGDLRGCIGTISPVTNNIANEIIRNAVEAAMMDPRFAPVGIDELHDLVISVDVLDEAEPIEDMSQLDVKNYGVIVTSGRKRGLLLPNLEGVDTVEDQVSIAKQKAGIYKNETFTMERFKVVRHK